MHGLLLMHLSMHRCTLNLLRQSFHQLNIFFLLVRAWASTTIPLKEHQNMNFESKSSREIARNQIKMRPPRPVLAIRTPLEHAALVGTLLPHLELHTVCCLHFLHVMRGSSGLRSMQGRGPGRDAIYTVSTPPFLDVAKASAARLIVTRMGDWG